MFFGGNEAEPEDCVPGATHFLNDTWAWVAACGAFEDLSKKRGPSPRGRYALAVHEEGQRMVLHGGRFREGDSGAYELLNDVWLFDFVTDKWTELATTGSGPTPRFDHDGVVIDGSLLVFGGNESASGVVIEPTNDTWMLDLDTGEWTEHATSTSPPARAFHSMAANREEVFVYGAATKMRCWVDFSVTCGSSHRVEIGASFMMGSEMHRSSVFGVTLRPTRACW